MIDAAIAAQTLKVRGKGSFDGDVILVRNETATEQERWAVVGLANPIITPTENEAEFEQRVTFDGIIPVDPTHVGKFAVLQEPLAAGAIGRACVYGVTQAKLRVDSGDDVIGFADIIDGDTTALANVSDGSARVLWAESSGSSDRWCLVALGGAGAGGANVAGTDCGPGCGWVAGLTEDDCLRLTLIEATGRCADDAENIDDYLTYEGGVWVLDTAAEGGGSGTGPPPPGEADDCTQCTTTPYRWSVPLADFTGSLAVLNGVYNIDQLAGYPCTWLVYGPGTGQATQLNIDGSAVTLYITPPSGYGATIEYTATIGSDCCSDLTLTISTPTADCPTTLTITPRC